MRKVKFYFPIFFVLAFSIAAHAQTFKFKGNIGEAKFQMTLERSGNEISGDYFYEKQGNAKKLNLKGSIDEGGNFTLKETDAAGKQTGIFRGKWSEDYMSAGAWLEGNWQKPGGGSELAFSAAQQSVYFTGNLSIVTRKITEANKVKMYEIDAEYPEIIGSASPAILKFNALAKQSVAKSVADFKKNMLEMTAEDLKFTKERGVSNYSEIGYDVEYADNNLVSIMFSEDTYTGGAHPNHYFYTVNYDLKTGRELSLAELFQPNSNYLNVISDYAINKLKSELTEMSDDEWIKNGAGADAENFKSWNISEKGLVLNFNPYQVAAYAAGPQFVVIPYDKLKGILKPNGVTASLQK